MTKNRVSPARVDGINPQDPGVGLLATALASADAREILLVGCGDIPGLGPGATRLVLDVRERADSVAQPRDLTDPLGPASFGHAVVWPRPHLGKDFTLWCLARGALDLREGGALWCAVRKSKGADSITDQIGGLMGEVDVVDRHRGYRLLRARRGPGFDEDRARQHLAARYVIEDPALPGLSLRSAPGVFSRRELDAGTRQLIEHARAQPMPAAPASVLDLGCGVGPLALWAATRWPRAQVLAVDSNLRAVALARDNAARHGLSDRVRVRASDGLPAALSTGLPANAEADAARALRPGAIELVLCNPPTHADPPTLGRLAAEVGEWLAPGGTAWWVVSRAGRMSEQLARAGARVRTHRYPRYTVLDADWGAGERA